jgi:hypothetical protein
MPEITMPEIKLPEIKLPDGLREMTRDDIVQAAKDVKLPKQVKLPDIDLSKIELPDAIEDRMPGRRQMNPIVPLLALTVVGLAVVAAWWLFTSATTGPRVRRAPGAGAGVHRHPAVARERRVDVLAAVHVVERPEEELPLGRAEQLEVEATMRLAKHTTCHIFDLVAIVTVDALGRGPAGIAGVEVAFAVERHRRHVAGVTDAGAVGLVAEQAPADIGPAGGVAALIEVEETTSDCRAAVGAADPLAVDLAVTLTAGARSAHAGGRFDPGIVFVVLSRQGSQPE